MSMARGLAPREGRTAMFETVRLTESEKDNLATICRELRDMAQGVAESTGDAETKEQALYRAGRSSGIALVEVMLQDLIGTIRG